MTVKERTTQYRLHKAGPLGGVNGRLAEELRWQAIRGMWSNHKVSAVSYQKLLRKAAERIKL